MARRLGPRLCTLGHEVFVVLGLDAKHRVVCERVVHRGTLLGVEVHPREVYRPLIAAGAAAAIVAHNHPSGDPSPSPDDIELTQRLGQVGELLGIALLDHVVIARDGFVSIADRLR